VIIALELASPLIVPIAFKVMKKTNSELPPGIYAACISIGIEALIVWIVVYKFSMLLAQQAGRLTTFEPRLMAIVGVTAVLFGGFFCWQMNTFEFYRAPEKAFVAQLKEQTAAIAPQQVGFFTSNNRSSAETLFYLDKPGLSTIIKDVNGLKSFLAGQPPRALISLRKGLPDGLEAQLERFNHEGHEEHEGKTNINSPAIQVIEEQAQKLESKGELGKKRIVWILNEPVTINLATDFTESKKRKKATEDTENSE
jgi:hypothetical protein